MHIDAIEDTFFLGEISGGEWETGRDGAGVHVTANLELVGTLRHSAIHSLFLLRTGDFTEDHLLAKEGFDFVLDEVEFIEGVGPECNIKTKTEELFGADLELIAELLGITNGGLKFGVANFAFFGVDVVAGLKLGNFLTEVFHHDGGFDGVDIHGDIEYFVDINEGGDPASKESARIGIDVDGAAVFSAKAKIARMEFERARRDKVAEGSDPLFKGLLNFGVFSSLRLSGDFGGSEVFGGVIFRFLKQAHVI